jgi:hypothetical protein
MKINKTYHREDWLNDFADKLAKSDNEPKNAVEAARQRNQKSMLDQISSIVGNKPVHSSVDSVVQEMQERTGLKEYLRRQSEKSFDNMPKKTASSYEEEIFKYFPPNVRDNIINFIKRRVETHHGFIALPALCEEILGTFKRDGVQTQDVDNQEVSRFINQLLIEEIQKNPSDMSSVNIGKGVGVNDMNDDGSNSDFFKGLLPATKQ